MTQLVVPEIGQVLVALFGYSRALAPDINRRWIDASARAGSKLPHSLLMVSIQRVGELDLVCRAVEMELLRKPFEPDQMDLRWNYLHLISEQWIGAAYSVCYILKDRALMTDAGFLDVADDLRKIRVQIEKFEIASDRSLKQPLHLSPIKEKIDEEVPVHVYDRKDRMRSHIPRNGRSERQSISWEVIDSRSMTSRWYERLDVAERLLDALGGDQ